MVILYFRLQDGNFVVRSYSKLDEIDTISMRLARAGKSSEGRQAARTHSKFDLVVSIKTNIRISNSRYLYTKLGHPHRARTSPTICDAHNQTLKREKSACARLARNGASELSRDLISIFVLVHSVVSFSPKGFLHNDEIIIY